MVTQKRDPQDRIIYQTMQYAPNGLRVHSQVKIMKTKGIEI